MKPKAKLPSQEVLRELLDYDSDSGKLFWKSRSSRFFKPGVRAIKQDGWNAGWAAKEAFTAEQFGYRVGMVFGVRSRAHRVIWKWVTGEDPGFLDHINGKKNDNRWVNLREATPAENQKNRKRNANNVSGVCGVCYVKATSKWRAQIKVNSRMIFLGDFLNFHDAVAARRRGEAQHMFHENHGKR